MVPQSSGLWRVESEGEQQNIGMRALYLVYNTRSWFPALARLGNSGSINAWSVETMNSWIQVDLLTPTLIHEIHTQGARQHLLSLYISQFVVSYSLDGKLWIKYQGNARGSQMVFFGNVDSSTVRENIFDPPIIARFLRLYPTHAGVRSALRMELFGCDITSCSLPLGLQRGDVTPQQFSASSYLKSMFSSWFPNLARLHQQGRVNAWRPQVDKSGEWLQLDIGYPMKVTGVVIQGARSAFTPMYVTHFSLSFSSDGHVWDVVQDPEGYHKDAARPGAGAEREIQYRWVGRAATSLARQQHQALPRPTWILKLLDDPFDLKLPAEKADLTTLESHCCSVDTTGTTPKGLGVDHLRFHLGTRLQDPYQQLQFPKLEDNERQPCNCGVKTYEEGFSQHFLSVLVAEELSICAVLSIEPVKKDIRHTTVKGLQSCREYEQNGFLEQGENNESEEEDGFIEKDISEYSQEDDYPSNENLHMYPHVHEDWNNQIINLNSVQFTDLGEDLFLHEMTTDAVNVALSVCSSSEHMDCSEEEHEQWERMQAFSGYEKRY
ncbi:coagulation factor VIII-like [Pelobates cultripes]|uniref:Coagulation factor VIII-like n=1 Tax=Pelobates cultripes TaxID=61616 RepID=A0AAD1WNP5_PELCU|nr:coagulation factor VIII-like [Pelobates cultripes]